jgi:hypothetical protein
MMTVRVGSVGVQPGPLACLGCLLSLIPGRDSGTVLYLAGGAAALYRCRGLADGGRGVRARSSRGGPGRQWGALRRPDATTITGVA